MKCLFGIVRWLNPIKDYVHNNTTELFQFIFALIFAYFVFQLHLKPYISKRDILAGGPPPSYTPIDPLSHFDFYFQHLFHWIEFEIR